MPEAMLNLEKTVKVKILKEKIDDYLDACNQQGIEPNFYKIYSIIDSVAE